MSTSWQAVCASSCSTRRWRSTAPPAAGDGWRSDRSQSALILAAVEREAGVLDAPTRAAVAERGSPQQALGLGPLERLLRDPLIDEVLVCGTRPIWVERGGRLEATDVAFETETALRETIERLLSRAGRRADESEPICDARTADGSRINVVLPPLAVDGPALTIRRFRPRGFSADDLVALGAWTPALRELLGAAVRGRLNLLVCGGTGSGKTTTLGALGGMIDDGERIVTIEDTAELRLPLAHVVRLEARPASVDGRGEVTIRALVRNALRMRPDRIIVGEVRGAEAHDMLAALATGHDGSLSTVHAGSPGRGAAPRRDARADGRRSASRTTRCGLRSAMRWTSSCISCGVAMGRAS